MEGEERNGKEIKEGMRRGVGRRGSERRKGSAYFLGTHLFVNAL